MRGRSGTALGQEPQVDRLRKDPGAELPGPDLGAGRVDVLQVRKHEAVLEALEEARGQTLTRRQ